MKLFGIVFLLVGLSSAVMAAVPNAPEVSPVSGVAALALLSGAILVIRGRRRKQ